MYTVYILKNSYNKLYIGYTSNIKERIGRHTSGDGAKYTQKYKDFTLVYEEEFETVLEARKREKQIKGWRREKKDNLIRFAKLIVNNENSINRCNWVNNNPKMIKYHDEEWGVPVFDDRKLFEFLTLESAQAGLSWETVLNKREGYKEAFANFKPEIVAKYDDQKVEELLLNPKIIRNRLKVKAAINNAQRFLEIRQEFGSFSKYIWQFVGLKPIENSFVENDQIPAKTDLSNQISNALIKRGFKFVGSTIIYAHMQATGMVNDHLKTCFRYDQIYGIGQFIPKNY